RIGIMHHGELVALDKTQSLIQKINRRNLTVNFATGEDFNVCLKEGDSLDHVIRDLAKSDREIIDIDMQKGDLEEAFLSLTREEGRKG
ncbi:hypothetical protein GW916_15585, partial [bacterium]|nr:hypothetical protein [bacterium]